MKHISINMLAREGKSAAGGIIICREEKKFDES